MKDIAEVFASEGTARDLAGNRPLPLWEAEGAWLVTRGPVDVFAVPLAGGAPAGARAHVCRVDAGGVLLAVPPACAAPGESPGLLAVGTPGTQAVFLNRARLLELAADPAWAGPWAELLGPWLQALAAGTDPGPPPKRLRPLTAGAAVDLDDGGPAGPAAGTVWVVLVAGGSWFAGQESLPLGPGDEPVPLPAPAWLAAAPGTRLTTLSPQAALADPHWWGGVARFQGLILARAAGQAAAGDAAARERRGLRAAAERRMLQAALAQLSAVAAGDGAESAAAADDTPLTAACRLVADRLGIALRLPRAGPGAAPARDPLADLARASHVRVRRVLLRGDWWRQDNGPLLAFQAGDGRPVAVLPVSPSRYEMVDPAARTRRPLTAEAAAALHPQGYVFYSPFSPGPLGLGDVLRLGLRGCRRDLLAVLGLGLAGGLLGMVPAVALGWLFGGLTPGSERGRVLFVVLALAVSTVAALLFRLAQGLATLRVQVRMESRVEAALWDRLLDLPAAFFRGHTAGDLAARALGVTVIRQAVMEVALTSLLGLAFSLVSFGLLFAYDARLAVLAAVVLAVLVAAGVGVALAQLRYEREVQHLEGKIAGLVLQLITGLARLRVAGAEGRALAVWADLFQQQRRLALRACSLTNGLTAFTAAVPLAATAALFAAVALAPVPGLSLGSFLAFNAAFLQVLLAAGSLGSSAALIVRVVPLYERARLILQTAPEVEPGRIDPGELRGEVEATHVTFRYQADGPLVLDDVSVRVRPGEFVAFVGPSGAGKSTLLRLLLGFEAPTAGTVYFDRQDLAGLDRRAVRRQIGVVLQNGRLLPGTLLDNIVGSAPLSLEDAWEAARLADLDADIAAMPMGMFTVLGEGTSTLSGGQRQRLMIARALATRPRILFFDEATSSLDNVAQAKVRDSLARLKVTRVVVAHRLSTVQYADCIYVLQGGQVVQQGRYDELARRPGVFADLVSRQLV